MKYTEKQQVFRTTEDIFDLTIITVDERRDLGIREIRKRSLKTEEIAKEMKKEDMPKTSEFFSNLPKNLLLIDSNDPSRRREGIRSLVKDAKKAFEEQESKIKSNFWLDLESDGDGPELELMESMMLESLSASITVMERYLDKEKLSEEETELLEISGQNYSTAFGELIRSFDSELSKEEIEEMHEKLRRLDMKKIETGIGSSEPVEA